MLLSLNDDVPILQVIGEKVYDPGTGRGDSFEKNIRSTLYREGVLQVAWTLEAARAAQRHTSTVFLTPEEMAKCGYEKFDIAEARIQELGLAGVMVRDRRSGATSLHMVLARFFMP